MPKRRGERSADMAVQDRPTSRGKFLAGVSAVAVGAAAPAAADASDGTTDYPVAGALYPNAKQPFGDPFKDIGGGFLVEYRPPNRLRLQDGGSQTTVEVMPGADIFTSKPARLEDFVVGERLAIEGTVDGGIFRATAVHSYLADLRTEVVQVNGTEVKTNAGRVHLTEATRYGWFGAGRGTPSKSDLRRGARVFALVRAAPNRDPEVVIAKIVPAR
jgi:hypothetical protein